MAPRAIAEAGGQLFRVFLSYLVCSGRPPHEILASNMLYISQAFDRQFVG